MFCSFSARLFPTQIHYADGFQLGHLFPGTAWHLLDSPHDTLSRGHIWWQAKTFIPEDRGCLSYGDTGKIGLRIGTAQMVTFEVVNRLARAISLEEGDCNPIYKALHHTTRGAKVPSVSSSDVLGPHHVWWHYVVTFHSRATRVEEIEMCAGVVLNGGPTDSEM